MIRLIFGFLRSYFAIVVVGATFIWSAVAIVSHRSAGVPPGAIIIRLGHWQLEASVREAVDKMAKEYREKINPNVYLIQDAIPEGTYGQWVSTQLMGGTAPDILQVGAMLPGNIWLSYYQRFFLPLGRYVERPNPHNAGTDFASVPLRKTYKDGMKTAYVDEMQEYMSIPLAQFGSRMFYNRDLLKKLTGLDAPPDEWRAFLKVCETIRSQTGEDGRNYIPIACSQYHFGMMGGLMWEPLTYRATEKADFNRDGSVGNDEQFVAFQTGRLDFDFLPYRARFKMIEELTPNFQSGYTGLTRDEAVFLFAQQKAVFMATGTWDARSLQEQASGEFEVGVMQYPFPTPDDSFYGPVAPARPREQVGTGFQFGIARSSQHPEVALDFLLFLASRMGNQELNQIIGWIPAIQGTETDPLLRAFRTEHHRNLSGDELHARRRNRCALEPVAGAVPSWTNQLSGICEGIQTVLFGTRAAGLYGTEPRLASRDATQRNLPRWHPRTRAVQRRRRGHDRVGALPCTYRESPGLGGVEPQPPAQVDGQGHRERRCRPVRVFTRSP
ncbi:MAG: ABC transporter substrate-binding protein [Kiritimatiellae bacterium]|nr:ABC transporter substrate-binding protein [Kiritimatiellia bacterium]